MVERFVNNVAMISAQSQPSYFSPALRSGTKSLNGASFEALPGGAGRSQSSVIPSDFYKYVQDLNKHKNKEWRINQFIKKTERKYFQFFMDRLIEIAKQKKLAVNVGSLTREKNEMKPGPATKGVLEKLATLNVSQDRELKNAAKVELRGNRLGVKSLEMIAVVYGDKSVLKVESRKGRPASGVRGDRARNSAAQSNPQDRDITSDGCLGVKCANNQSHNSSSYLAASAGPGKIDAQMTARQAKELTPREREILADYTKIQENARRDAIKLRSEASWPARYAQFTNILRNTLNDVRHSEIDKTEVIGAKKSNPFLNIALQSLTTLTNFFTDPFSMGRGYGGGWRRGRGRESYPFGLETGGSISPDMASQMSPIEGQESELLRQGFIPSGGSRNDLRYILRNNGSIFDKPIGPGFYAGFTVATNVVAELADMAFSPKGSTHHDLKEAKKLIKDYGTLLAKTTSYLSDETRYRSAVETFSSKDADLNKKLGELIEDYVNQVNADYPILPADQQDAITFPMIDGKRMFRPTFGYLVLENNKGGRDPKQNQFLKNSTNQFVQFLRGQINSLEQIQQVITNGHPKEITRIKLENKKP